MAERPLTPLQQERLAAWVDETRRCAQLSNAALADQVEKDVCECCDLTRHQLTILLEACDRLRGIPAVTNGRI